MPLGIGVITYRRPLLLNGCLRRIKKYTKVPHYLVVAEDGGNDGTVDLLRHNDVTTVTGQNRGVCWNKNRALTLLQNIGADPIILLEDDCWPREDSWAYDWIAAANLWKHVNYTHPHWPTNWCKGGAGTPGDPYRGWELTGQATITTNDALSAVGFLNTDFKGYGYGHIEWTERFCKAGILSRPKLPSIVCGLELRDSQTFRIQEQVNKNWHLFTKLQKQPFYYCPPAQNDDDIKALNLEIATALQKTPIHL